MSAGRARGSIVGGLVAAAVILGAGACAPEDYPKEPAHETAEAKAGASAGEDVTGGTDPRATSGLAPGDTAAAIHHPAADGNSGRPPARDATTFEADAAAPPAR